MTIRDLYIYRDEVLSNGSAKLLVNSQPLQMDSDSLLLDMKGCRLRAVNETDLLILPPVCH